jgi:asparagine synthase (glutamine-hydrolysing)
VPIENYFQQPEFRDMMEDLVGDNAIRKRGLFQPEAVRELRAAMDRKEFLFVKQVFSLMILELWFRIYVDRRPEYQSFSSNSIL